MEQILQKKHDKKIKLFEQAIRSEHTKKVYTVCLNKYLEFPGSNKKHATDPKKIEEHVIDYIIFLKKQGKGFTAIHNYASAIYKYYKMNDVFLNINKINQYLPEFRKSKKDREYRYQEIQRLLDIVDERYRTIILLLASTGMRVGAIPSLRLRNIEKVESEYSDNGIYKITVYEGFKEEYITFTTPECTIAIDNYLKFREDYGEILTKDSFLIREQFDIRDPFAISKCKEVKAITISRNLINLAERSGIRQREILVEGKHRATVRKDVPIVHGFRKFFTSQLVEADLKTELRWLLEGHNLKGNDSNYVRVSEKRLQQEYEKAINHLTINEENRLKMKVEKLEIEKSEMDDLELRLKKLEAKIE